MSAAARKAHTIEVMTAMAARASSQADFTARKVAMACGVSSTLLYRVASEEFRAIRAALPGQHGVDQVVTNLRAKLADNRRELKRLRQIEERHATCPTLEDVTNVVELNDRLEEENRSLRAQLDHLRRNPSVRPVLRPVDDLS